MVLCCGLMWKQFSCICDIPTPFFTQLYLLYVFHPSSIVQHPNNSGLLSCKYCILPLLLADGVQMKTSFALKKKKKTVSFLELTFLGTLCSMRAKNHNTSLQGFSYGIDVKWDSDGEREGFRGQEQRTRGEWKVRKNVCAKYRELSKNKKKGHGNKKRGWGLGGFYSQVFLPFEEGIPPFKEENN